MNTLRAVLFGMIVCFATTANALDLWGTVVLNTGTPAAGVELRLIHKGSMLPTRILTNSVGRFGLYKLAAPTTDYKLLVLRNGVTVKEMKLPVLRNNTRIPNIVMP